MPGPCFLRNRNQKIQEGPEESREHDLEIVVLGAGVVGLTTALELQQRGKGQYKVTVVADAFPGDPGTSVKYTSQWAGAHHVYNMRDRTKYPNDELYHLEKDTFKTLWELSEPNTETDKCFLRMLQTQYSYDDHVTKNSPGPELFEEMPSYQSIPLDQLPPSAISGCTFETVSIDVPIYLNWLLTRFTRLGGHTVRGHVQHLGQITEGGTTIFEDPYPANAKNDVNTALEVSGHSVSSPSASSLHYSKCNGPNPAASAERIHRRRKLGKVDAVVVCTGLSTRVLGGVEDMTVYPVRGQTVIVRAPWIRAGIGGKGKKDEKGEKVVTYVIPRRSGEVILGGTAEPNDWYPQPREETTNALLKRAFKLCPHLAPPEIRAVREPKLDDVLSCVVNEGCGLRPAREGGVRIESEWWSNKGKRVLPDEKNVDDKVLVVYNYGHGGYGYQSSWGTARKASDLLEAGLEMFDACKV